MANPFRLFKNPINIYFVGSNGYGRGYDYPPIMVTAYKQCQRTGIQPKWMTYDACLHRKPEKTDIFVLHSFEGPVFQQLQTAKCSIFGPIYLLDCLHTNKPIPPDTSPVLNTSMQDVIAYFSGYTHDDKLFYRQRIEQMSGNICTKPLCQCITHVIYDSAHLITPAEYDNAKTRGIEVFTTDWINLVWSANNQSHNDPIPLPDPFPLPSPIPVLNPSIINKKLREKPKAFQGLTFLMTSDAIRQDIIRDNITDLNGKIVSKDFRGIPDFAVVPFNSKNPKLIAKEIVTDIYINDCMRKNARVAIQYYHRPIYIPRWVNEPLKICVIVIAQYSGGERDYLSKLAKELGAREEEIFDVNVTYCICKYSKGDKYIAAVRWKIPAVTGEWLRACADELRYVDEEPFLVGDTRAREGVNVMRQLNYGYAGRTGEQIGAQKSKSMEKFKFMISGFGDATKDQEKLIRKLGGEVVSLYDDSVTHMVCIRPSKCTSGKIMSCIAGGKWVLHWSYLRDSEKFGSFIDEERYEWGNPRNVELMIRLKDRNNRKIASAAYKWRKNKGRGVFEGMVAMLTVRGDIYDEFGRLIRAGGGTLVEDPYDKKITHCFIDNESRKNEFFFEMACNGIWCYPIEFLYTLITTDGVINPRDHVAPKFQKYMALLP